MREIGALPVELLDRVELQAAVSTMCEVSWVVVDAVELPNVEPAEQVDGTARSSSCSTRKRVNVGRLRTGDDVFFSHTDTQCWSQIGSATMIGT